MNRLASRKAVVVAALVFLCSLVMLLALNQVSATGSVRMSWSQLDLYADHHHQPITPTLTVDHTLGQPGSYFVVTGQDYAAFSCYRVMVNDTLVNAYPLCADGNGSFRFELYTPLTDEGGYVVSVSVEGQPGASTYFAVSSSASTLWPTQNLTDSFEIPEGIAMPFLLYLPVVVQSRSAPEATAVETCWTDRIRGYRHCARQHAALLQLLDI
jgi:hypothetical protein